MLYSQDGSDGPLTAHRNMNGIGRQKANRSRVSGNAAGNNARCIRDRFGSQTGPGSELSSGPTLGSRHQTTHARLTSLHQRVYNHVTTPTWCNTNLCYASDKVFPVGSHTGRDPYATIRAIARNDEDDQNVVHRRSPGLQLITANRVTPNTRAYTGLSLVFGLC